MWGIFQSAFGICHWAKKCFGNHLFRELCCFFVVFFVMCLPFSTFSVFLLLCFFACLLFCGSVLLFYFLCVFSVFVFLLFSCVCLWCFFGFATCLFFFFICWVFCFACFPVLDFLHVQLQPQQERQDSKDNEIKRTTGAAGATRTTTTAKNDQN